jgi:hypothetical protein
MIGRADTADATRNTLLGYQIAMVEKARSLSSGNSGLCPARCYVFSDLWVW